MRILPVALLPLGALASPFERRQAATAAPSASSASSISTSRSVAGSRSTYSAPRPSGFTQALAFTAPPLFPSLAFGGAFYSGYEATQTSVEPQPKISDAAQSAYFALNLTAPSSIPSSNEVDPVFLPPSNYTHGPLQPYMLINTSTPTTTALRRAAVANLTAIINGTASSDNSTCSRCLAGLQVAQQLARTAPQEVPIAMYELCQRYKFSTSVRPRSAAPLT